MVEGLFPRRTSTFSIHYAEEYTFAGKGGNILWTRPPKHYSMTGWGLFVQDQSGEYTVLCVWGEWFPENMPPPVQLEVLKILWDRGPCTARQVWGVLNERRKRHLTSVNSLLNTMADKGLLRRHSEQRPSLYEANIAQEQTQGQLVRDLVGRAFEGSPSALVLQVLDHCNPSPEEMDEIAKTIRQYRKQRGKR